MPGVLSFIPSWAWRWIAILGILVGAFGTGYFKGRETVQEKFDDYKAAVKEAGDRQNELTKQTIALNQQRAENAESKAQTLSAERDAATLRLRDIQGAIAGVSLVPAPAAGSASGNRVCFASDKLDRGLRTALTEAATRLEAIARLGQQGVDTAIVCRDWAHAIQGAEGNR